MYNGYVESEEKIDARKRRILGTVVPPEAPPAQDKHKARSQGLTAKEMLKRQLLIMAILYPIAFFIGDLLGRYVATLVR
jgi:hypothetical protein